MEILHYDKDNLKQWEGIFDIASPQECANTFNKVISVDTTLYYPHTFDFTKEAIVKEVFKNVEELKEVLNEDIDNKTKVLNYQFVLGKYYGAMWTVKEALGYDIFCKIADETNIVKELEKQGNELVERVMYGR